MDLKLVRNIFLLCFFFSGNSAGSFARCSKDGAHGLPFDPEFHLRISKFDSKIQNDRPTVRQLTEDPGIHREEEPTLYTAHRVIYPQSEPESLDTMSQRDVVTPTTTVPTINPSTPTTTTPIYNPTPTMTPVTNPYTTPTYPDTTPTNPATNPYSTPAMGNPTTPTPAMGNPTTPTPAMGNPTTPTPAMGNPTTPTPAMGNPTSGGQSWCVASPSASETALQVGLDYACGYGGADCSAIQQGGSCFNPDTVRDHASYAFNSYYQKNPTPTSCDFSGTAVITNTDPSTSTCHYPSSSTSSSTLNTTNPTGGGSTVFGSSPPVFGSSPPDYTDTNSSSTKTSSSFTLICFLATLIYLKVYK